MIRQFYNTIQIDVELIVTDFFVDNNFTFLKVNEMA